MRLQDKVAVVTGAASGFGEGIARRFAAEGAKVVLSDRTDAAGEGVAAEIVATGGAAAYVHADVTDSSQVGAMIGAAVEEMLTMQPDPCARNSGTTSIAAK